MLYSPTDVAPQFLWKLTPFIYILSTYAYDSWALYAVFRMIVTSDFLKDHLVYFDAPSKLITFVHSVIKLQYLLSFPLPGGKLRVEMQFWFILKLMLFSFSWLAAIKNSPHVIQGAVSTGHQYHFHMETQVTNELFSALFFLARIQKGLWMAMSHFASSFFTVMGLHTF